MVRRYLSLSVALVAPASASAMLVMGVHPIDPVTFVERASCVLLALLAATLALVHLRIATTANARVEAAMWGAMTMFLAIATFARPHLGFWIIAGTLWLAGTSVAALVAEAKRGRARAWLEARASFRRGTFA